MDVEIDHAMLPGKAPWVHPHQGLPKRTLTKQEGGAVAMSQSMGYGGGKKAETTVARRSCLHPIVSSTGGLRGPECGHRGLDDIHG